MLQLLESGLHSRSGVIRKGCALALQAPKRSARSRRSHDELVATPPALANSFPKSGTHLLDQIVEALPARCNYGEFLSSMTSSFRFQRRTPEECCEVLDRSLPGEIVRGHVFFDESIAAKLRELRFVHYFIYRDPRDVAVSEAHYYRTINRWHRLHGLFRDAPTLNAAIMLAIEGIADPSGRLYYPNIGARFRHYQPWIQASDVCALKFEDLTSHHRESEVRRMIEFYASHAAETADVAALTEKAIENIAPQKSHTFRQGKQGGWRETFTEEHRSAFKRHAGDILIQCGYETSNDW